MSTSTYSDYFIHATNVLEPDDIEYLVSHCKTHLERDDAIPSYVLINHLQDKVVKKIQDCVEKSLGQEVYYLNDFYFYTDSEFQSSWHVDTELFAFNRAVNAWILLSPDTIDSPLCFMNGVNESPDEKFHTVKYLEEDIVLYNMASGGSKKVSARDIEENRIATPDVSVGDILLLNPGYFHRTNVTAPKHCIALKFVLKENDKFLSDNQVPALYWKEVGLFNDFLGDQEDWGVFLDKVRNSLDSDDGRKALSAGFYPEKITLYQEKIAKI